MEESEKLFHTVFSKKRKMDSWSLNQEWTGCYMFSLFKGSSKPACLVCSETLVIISGNVKLHYETKHWSFEETHRLTSEMKTHTNKQPNMIRSLTFIHCPTCILIERRKEVEIVVLLTTDKVPGHNSFIFLKWTTLMHIFPKAFSDIFNCFIQSFIYLKWESMYLLLEYVLFIIHPGLFEIWQ